MEEKEKEKKPTTRNSTVKVLILGLTTLGTSILFWYNLYGLLYGQKDSGETWFMALAGALLFLVSLGLVGLMVEKLIPAFLIFSLSFAVFFLAFGWQSFYPIVIGLGIIGYLIGWRRIKSERHSQLKVRAVRFTRAGLPIIATFLCVIISSAYYFTPSVQETKTGFALPIQYLEALTKPFEKIIGVYVPGFSPEMTVDELIGSIIAKEGAESQGLNDKFSIPQILLQQKQLLTQEMIKTIRNQYAKQFGIELTSNQKVLEALREAITGRVNSLLGSYVAYIPLGLAISLFFILKTSSMIFLFPVYLITWLAVKLLLMFGIAKIEETTVEGENIVF